jgi:hypothetical protein
MLAPIQYANSQSSSTRVSVVPAKSTTRVGEVLSVNITLSNVQNLYGLDVTLDWNSSVLQLFDSTLNLDTNSIPGGVLYGNQISNDITSNDVYVNESLSTISEYHLFATSVAPAASFNGSGTIVTLVFNVTSIGHSDLNLQSELADHPEPGETNSEPIIHDDVSGSVDAAAIPEFPEMAILALFIAFATVALLFSKKLLKKNTLLKSATQGTVKN